MNFINKCNPVSSSPNGRMNCEKICKIIFLIAAIALTIFGLLGLCWNGFAGITSLSRGVFIGCMVGGSILTIVASLILFYSSKKSSISSNSSGAVPSLPAVPVLPTIPASSPPPLPTPAPAPIATPGLAPAPMPTPAPALLPPQSPQNPLWGPPAAAPSSSIAKPPNVEPKIQSNCPYYAGKVGIPNPDNNECSRNSLAQACAHTDILEKAIERKRKERADAITKAQKDLQVEEKRVQEAEGIVSRIKADVDVLKRECLQSQEQLAAIKQEEQQLETRLKAEMQVLRQKINPKDDDFIEAGKIRNRQTAITTKIEELQRQINHKNAEIDDKHRRLNHEEMLKSRAIAFKDQQDKSLKELEASNRSCQREENRALEVLEILRGQKKGEFRPNDMANIHEILGDHIILRAQSEEALKTLFFNTDWRVIRIGTHQHYFVYVRRQNKTVVEINDDFRIIDVNPQVIYDNKVNNWHSHELEFFYASDALPKEIPNVRRQCYLMT